MKHRLLLLLLTFISITAFGQAWQDGGNGLQFRYIGGFREVRQLVKTPQPPFAITDSLNKFTNLLDTGTIGANTTGSAVYHNGYTLDGGGPYDTGFDNIFARTTGTQQLRMITPTGLANALGYGTAAMKDTSFFDLQRATDVNRSTTNGIVIKGKTGGFASFRPDFNMELSNELTGGHAGISILNVLANDEAGITMGGKLSNGNIVQTASQYNFFVDLDNTAGNYRTVMGWHMPDAFGDKEPLNVFSNNSVQLLGGNTSDLPFNDMPPENTVEIKGDLKVNGNSSLDGTIAASNLSGTNTGDQTLATITSGGATTPNTITSSNANAFKITGVLGNPAFLSVNQTAQSGGKIWRIGNTGGSTLTTFDLLNETDGVLALSFSTAGDAIFSGGITASTYSGGAELTGTPTAPTPTIGDNSTKIATTAYADRIASSGTYVPTFSNLGANVSSVSNVQAFYTKIGDIVTVSGSLGITVSSTGAGSMNISLPIASALSSTGDLTGTASQGLIGSAYVEGSPSTDTANLQNSNGLAGTYRIYYTFTYKII